MAPVDSTATTRATRAPEPDDLHRPHDGVLVVGRHDHGRVVGEAGEQAAGVVQHLLQLAVGPGEEGLDLRLLGRLQRPAGVR